MKWLKIVRNLSAILFLAVIVMASGSKARAGSWCVAHEEGWSNSGCMNMWALAYDSCDYRCYTGCYGEPWNYGEFYVDWCYDAGDEGMPGYVDFGIDCTCQ